jgi:hypothetical protein
LRRPWAGAGTNFARGFSRTLDGGSERMKTQNPISQKEMGFSFFRAKNQKVILDKDLSRLYGIETRTLNQAVRQNAERFPADSVFKLTRDESMRISEFVISSALLPPFLDKAIQGELWNAET